MAKFHISWNIELDADDMVSAAKEALKIQRDPKSTATLFVVSGEDEQDTIDLLEESRGL